jgi:NADH-quinone oxidoreductase subunit A
MLQGHLITAIDHPGEALVELDPYLAIGILVLLATGLSLIVVFISTLMGPHKPTAKKLSPYESGMTPIGPGIRRLPVKFYLIAVLFILFDVEIIFLLPYAVLVRELGVPGLVVVGEFVFVLAVGLVYAWKKGALEWE